MKTPIVLLSVLLVLTGCGTSRISTTGTEYGYTYDLVGVNFPSGESATVLVPALYYHLNDLPMVVNVTNVMVTNIFEAPSRTVIFTTNPPPAERVANYTPVVREPAGAQTQGPMPPQGSTVVEAAGAPAPAVAPGAAAIVPPTVVVDDVATNNNQVSVTNTTNQVSTTNTTVGFTNRTSTTNVANQTTNVINEPAGAAATNSNFTPITNSPPTPTTNSFVSPTGSRTTGAGTSTPPLPEPTAPAPNTGNTATPTTGTSSGGTTVAPAPAPGTAVPFTPVARPR
jgi:hypothetical protein